mmetsp:Transcript_15970/g.31571  ORF Transcript_15970/g.31571 Transcript_15970/m.31571 type:complete len:204 (+) Transcript_15970:98-709(+)
MDGLVVAGHRSLLDRLRHGGVRVARASNVLARGAILHGKRSLVDLLARAGAHDVNSQDLVGVLARDELGKTLRIPHSTSAAVGHEGKGPLAVLDARCLHLLLRHANRRHLRVRVDNAGDHAVVDVPVLACERLHARHALLLCLVSEHRTSNAVADGIHARDASEEVARSLGLDPLSLIELDTDSLKPKVLCARAPPNSNKSNV